MCMRHFLLSSAVATVAAMPAMAQTPSAAGRAGSDAHHARPIHSVGGGCFASAAAGISALWNNLAVQAEAIWG